jgi:hypothetical protein
MINDLASLSKRLESLCERILIASGYRVLSKSDREDPGIDFVVADPKNQEHIAVEVKLYRSPRVERSILRNAGVQIIHYKQTKGVQGMLIATATFDERDLRLLRNIGVDEVWGLHELSAKAEVSAELAAELEQLLRDAELGYAGAPVGVETETAEVLYSLESPQPEGEQLVAKLQSTSVGRSDARSFEDLCSESIKYLFGEHLGQFQHQNRVEDGFHYMDLIVRLSPRETGAFWVSLAQDFRCRYVVFEFKNYAEAISQNQVYSTEKYLYPNALRSVAIIIARNGADKGAIRAVQGALREAGKVMLILSLDHVLELLRAKDRGIEPSDLMIDHLDRLLTTIAP